MEKRISKLMRITEHLMNGIRIDSFDERLTLQKYVYLALQAGFDLGFRYSWYHYGPYSPSLTEAAYYYKENKKYYDELPQMFRLSEAGKQSLNKVRALVCQGSELGVEEPQWLELLASIHYLKWIAYGNEGVTRNSIAKRLKTHGKEQFQVETVKSAWDALDKAGLIDNKVLT